MVMHYVPMKYKIILKIYQLSASLKGEPILYD